MTGGMFYAFMGLVVSAGTVFLFSEIVRDI
jgi:hypothetical protein